VDRAERPEQQHDDLDGCEQPEPQRVAGHDLAARDRGRQQPLERPAGPLAEEAHARQDVDEEVREERDDRRGKRGHRVVRGGAVGGLVNDLGLGGGRRLGDRRSERVANRRDRPRVRCRIESTRDDHDPQRRRGSGLQHHRQRGPLLLDGGPGVSLALAGRDRDAAGLERTPQGRDQRRCVRGSAIDDRHADRGLLALAQDERDQAREQDRGDEQDRE
jgi:hypothetical protein